jgi:hypothetical protein
MDEQYVYIDSRHRNTSTYKNSNEYTIFLVRPITSICRVDLVSASVPITTTHITDKNASPYIFLDIEQFRSKYGVQSSISNAVANTTTTPIIQNYFAQLFYGSVSNTQFTSSNLNAVTGNVTYYSNIQTYRNYSEYEYKTSVSFQQPIESLDRLNIRWVDYDNKLVVFDPSSTLHSFLLRIYTTQKKIDPPPLPMSNRWLMSGGDGGDDIKVYILISVLIMCLLILLKSA